MRGCTTIRKHTNSRTGGVGASCKKRRRRQEEEEDVRGGEKESFPASGRERVTSMGGTCYRAHSSAGHAASDKGRERDTRRGYTAHRTGAEL